MDRAKVRVRSFILTTMKVHTHIMGKMKARILSMSKMKLFYVYIAIILN